MSIFRRHWLWVAAVAPAYGLAQALRVTAGSDGELGPKHTIFSLTALLLKLITLPSLALLLGWVTERIGIQTTRWRTASAVWAGLGFVTVLTASANIETLHSAGENQVFHRVWPTLPIGSAEAHPIMYFGSSYTVTRIVIAELIAVVSIAILAGLTAKYVSYSRSETKYVIPQVAIFSGLIVYDAIMDWPFTRSYDLAAGDAVLGATFGELAFGPIPVEPSGAAALGLAAASMTCLLWRWGGPLSPTKRRLSKYHQQVDLEATQTRFTYPLDVTQAG